MTYFTLCPIPVGLLQCLLDPEAVIRHTAAQDIGAVAALDIPNKRWGGPSGLIPMLLQVGHMHELSFERGWVGGGGG